jgi:hypothetical protein
MGASKALSDQFGSGGGFSHWNERDPDASYQDKAVEEYLKLTQDAATPPFPPKGAFNKKGRANPDVSALGEGFNVVMNGRVSSIGGETTAALSRYKIRSAVTTDAQLTTAPRSTDRGPQAPPPRARSSLGSSRC